jgi:lipid A 3-O-deacylase
MPRNLFLLLLLVCAAPVFAQNPTAVGDSTGAPVAPTQAGGDRLFFQPRSFTFYVENDALPHALGGSDRAYTQGLRLAWDFAAWPSVVAGVYRWTTLLPLWHALAGAAGAGFMLPAKSCPEVMPSSHDPCGTFGFAFGQTMYTPDTLLITTTIPTDRPYAGYLYGTINATAVWPRVTLSQELALGTTGAHSLAKHTQSMAHWAWTPDSEQPLGWDTQLRSQLFGTLATRLVYHSPIEYCRGGCSNGFDETRIFDIVPQFQAGLGNGFTFAQGGLAMRLGYNMPRDFVVQRIPVTARRGVGSAPRWIQLFATADIRAVGYNGFLMGGYRDDGRAYNGEPGWRELRAITPRSTVTEYGIGLATGKGRFTLAYQNATRSPEFEPVGNRGWLNYGSFTLAIVQGRTAD